MSIWIDTARVAVALNMLLLGVLGSVWTRNYLRLRSKHTLGMLVFATLLFFENGFALFFSWSTRHCRRGSARRSRSSPGVQSFSFTPLRRWQSAF